MNIERKDHNKMEILRTLMGLSMGRFILVVLNNLVHDRIFSLIKNWLTFRIKLEHWAEGS